jgi:hypothetical protein
MQGRRGRHLGPGEGATTPWQQPDQWDHVNTKFRSHDKKSLPALFYLSALMAVCSLCVVCSLLSVCCLLSALWGGQRESMLNSPRLKRGRRRQGGLVNFGRSSTMCIEQAGRGNARRQDKARKARCSKDNHGILVGSRCMIDDNDCGLESKAPVVFWAHHLP